MVFRTRARVVEVQQVHARPGDRLPIRRSDHTRDIRDRSHAKSQVDAAACLVVGQADRLRIVDPLAVRIRGATFEPALARPNLDDRRSFVIAPGPAAADDVAATGQRRDPVLPGFVRAGGDGVGNQLLVATLGAQAERPDLDSGCEGALTIKDRA